jgi:D-alanyl-D-alanine dipeptidase
MRNAIIICVLLFVLNDLKAQDLVLHEGFSDVKEHIPDISVDLRYYSSNNFVGDTITGYHCNKLILANEVIGPLKQVQKELKKRGLGLLVFDGYRPQRSVEQFVKWAKRINDTVMKPVYYPQVSKQNLFKEGYIASKSGHSRGSTVDLTLIDLKTGVPLDMGSPFDYFGKESWVEYSELLPEQIANRRLLSEVMRQFGFRGYAKEWWHFTLVNEPYPDTYFNFPITCPSR